MKQAPQLRPRDIIRHIAKLKELRLLGAVFQDFAETAPRADIDFRYNKWSLYTRLIHLLYVPLYTTIISGRFAEFYYVDLFAGGGIGILELEGDSAHIRDRIEIPIGGSPLIAMCFAAKKQFSGFFLVENDRKRAFLLKKRIEKFSEIASQESLRQKYSLPCSPLAQQVDPQRDVRFFDEANRAVDKIMRYLEERHEELLKNQKGVHAYVFIDPEGMELKRKSLDRILNSNVRTDILEIFNTYGVAMQAHGVLRGKYGEVTLNEFLGEGWMEFVSRKAEKYGKKPQDLTLRELAEILTEYRKRTYEQAGRKVLKISIRLDIPGQARCFDMFISSKWTRGGNPYFNAFQSISWYVETAGKSRYQVVDEFVHYVCTGELHGLLEHLVENPEEVMQEYNTMKRYGEKLIE
jgi:three-Cys-motif partner protein